MMSFLIPMMIVLAMMVTVVMISVVSADCHEWEQNTEQIRQDYRLFRSWHANDCDCQTDILNFCHVAPRQEDGGGDENDDVFLLNDGTDYDNSTKATQRQN